MTFYCTSIQFQTQPTQVNSCISLMKALIIIKKYYLKRSQRKPLNSLFGLAGPFIDNTEWENAPLMEQHLENEMPGLVATWWEVDEWQVARCACLPQVSVVVRARTACAQRKQTLWSASTFAGTVLTVVCYDSLQLPGWTRILAFAHISIVLSAVIATYLNNIVLLSIVTIFK